MSMTPKIRLRPRARMASTPARRMPLTTASARKIGSGIGGLSLSQSDVGLPHERLVGEVGGPSLVADPPDVEQVGAVDEGQHLADILLDDEDRVPLLTHLTHQVEDPEDHDGGKPGRWLVEEDELRSRHEGAADGEHLLLAARHGSR